MAERKGDRFISFLQSVALHGAIVALLAYGWWMLHRRAQPPQPQTLAIEAVAIENQPAKAAPPPLPAPAPPPPQEPASPPAPSAEEIAEREAQEQKAEAERKQEEQRLAEEKERQALEEKRAAEKKRAEREAAEKAAEAKRLAEKKRLEDEKRKTDEKRKADEKKNMEESRQRAQQEAELRRSLEQEERVMAARSSGMLASWQAQITARIQRAWLRPPTARSGIDCMVYVTQVPGGEVTQVRVGSCNGDQAVRESIEAAVYRASPLPPPPDPALFERNLEIRFKPVD